MGSCSRGAGPHIVLLLFVHRHERGCPTLAFLQGWGARTMFIRHSAHSAWGVGCPAGGPILSPTTLGVSSERGCPTLAFFARVGSTDHVHPSQRAFRQVCRMSACPDVCIAVTDWDTCTSSPPAAT